MLTEVDLRAKYTASPSITKLDGTVDRPKHASHEHLYSCSFMLFITHRMIKKAMLIVIPRLMSFSLAFHAGGFPNPSGLSLLF